MFLDANNRPLGNSHIKMINHRGFNEVAPENTLPAYKLSVQKGFKYVECDVDFTSDGYAVLIHDDTVDRTSNGTGSIRSLTFAQVRSLDFGSWKSTKYVGTRIPTFEEFILLCKKLGLCPYIEIKSTITAENAKTLIDIVKRYDMLKHSTWISFGSSNLEYIKAEHPSARLGLCISSASTSYITWASSQTTDENEVFLDMRYASVTSAFVESCITAGVSLEVWTVNTDVDFKSLDPYISGVTTDSLRAYAPLYYEFE